MKSFAVCLSILTCLLMPAHAAGTKKSSPKAAKPPAASAPAVPAPAIAKLYDFKGIPLEIPIEEFRNRPHPDGRAASVVCTGDAGAPYNVHNYDEVEVSLGVKKCIWYGEYLPGNTMKEAVPLNLAGTEYASYEYEFDFVPDPKDGVAKLYKFQGSSSSNATADVVTAMSAKFGNPVITTAKVQNVFGASFDQTTANWTNPAATILVQDRWTKIDDMLILMTDKRLSDIVNTAKALKKAAPNGI
jgi:hypothetical protein